MGVGGGGRMKRWCCWKASMEARVLVKLLLRRLVGLEPLMTIGETDKYEMKGFAE